MEKVIRKYGVIVLLYVVVIGGALLLSSRLRYLSEKQTTINNVSTISICNTWKSEANLLLL